METEQLKHFLEDASFLEENKFQIDCKLHALEEEKENGRTKVAYHLSNQKREYSLFVSSFFFFLFIIAAVLVHFIIVPLIYFLFFAIFFSNYIMFRIICDIIILLILGIIPAFSIIGYIKETHGRMREKKEKKIHDQNEIERMQYAEAVIIPKIEQETTELQNEYQTYDIESKKLFELVNFPEEYRNFESLYVMQIYMSKYKLTTKKQLLNACDRYFQRKELRSEIQIADAYLKETESSIMCSFQEMTNSVQRSMNSMITAIDSQNYELEKVKQKTEKDRKNAELLLDWNLMK